MNVPFFKTVLCRNVEKKQNTLLSAHFQILSRRYLKNHPELLEENNENHTERQPATKNKNWKPPPLIEITGLSVTVGKLVIKFLAESRFNSW